MAQSALQDGFVAACVNTSLNFLDGKCRILMEGQYIPNVAFPVTADAVIRIPGTRNIDNMFGAGSPLAEALKNVFCVCPQYVEVYALPRLDAAGAVAAVYTMTVTGPATTDGTIDLWLGSREASANGVIVTNGDTAATIAANIAAAIPAACPYTVTVAAGVLTFTAKNGGTIGNYLNPVVNWRGLQNYFPSGVTITTVSTTVGSGNPLPIPSYDTALGECCYDTFGLLTDDRTWQKAMGDYIATKWDCTRPQCFGQGYTFNSGTLGQVLAAGSNSAEFIRLAVSANPLSYPFLRVANYVARSACSACDNPELSIQGKVNGLMTCVWEPSSCSAEWSFSDIEQLRENAFAVMGPAYTGQGQLTNLYVYNDVTNYLYDEEGRENYTYRDASSRREIKKIVVAVAEKIQESNGLGLFTQNTRIPKGVFGTTKRMMLAIIHKFCKDNVGILFSEFDNLETDVTLKEDFEIAPPCQGKPCVMHLNMRFRPPCRLSRVNVNMLPQYIDNCQR